MQRRKGEGREEKGREGKRDRDTIKRGASYAVQEQATPRKGDNRMRLTQAG